MCTLTTTIDVNVHLALPAAVRPAPPPSRGFGPGAELGDDAVAHDDVAPQQAGDLPRRGAVDGLAELEAQAAGLARDDPAAQWRGAVAELDAVHLLVRAVEDGVAHGHGVRGQRRARPDGDRVGRGVLAQDEDGLGARDPQALALADGERVLAVVLADLPPRPVDDRAAPRARPAVALQERPLARA